MHLLINRGLIRPGQEVFFQYKRELYIALVEKDGRLAVPESDSKFPSLIVRVTLFWGPPNIESPPLLWGGVTPFAALPLDRMCSLGRSFEALG